LYNVKEMLASRLNTIHNIWYFSDFMRRMRASIARGTFAAFRQAFYRAQKQEAPEVVESANRDAGTMQRMGQDV
jgi:queuine tRNA-ribosyltransferase